MFALSYKFSAHSRNLVAISLGLRITLRMAQSHLELLERRSARQALLAFGLSSRWMSTKMGPTHRLRKSCECTQPRATSYTLALNVRPLVDGGLREEHSHRNTCA